MTDYDHVIELDWGAIAKTARDASLTIQGTRDPLPVGRWGGELDAPSSEARDIIETAAEAGILEAVDGDMFTEYRLSETYREWRKTQPADYADADIHSLHDTLGLDAPDTATEPSAGDATTGEHGTGGDADSGESRDLAAEAAAVAADQPPTGAESSPTASGTSPVQEFLTTSPQDDAWLPDAGRVQDAIEAAADYYHSELTDEHRSLLELKWGITPRMQDEIGIGFAPRDDDLISTLLDAGFDPVTIIRAGLTTPSVLNHAFGTQKQCRNGDCWHDVPDVLDELARRRGLDSGHSDRLRLEDISATAVLKYASDNDLFEITPSSTTWWDNRIVFPYRHSGRVQYMIARATGSTDDMTYDNGEVAKYLKQTSDKPWVDSNAVNEPIYGVDTVQQDEHLIITEGMTDAIMAHQAGFPCISPVTKQFKSEHHRPLLLQAQRASTVYLCLDNEESGEGLKGAVKTGLFLEENDIQTRIATLPRGADEEKVDLADYLREHDGDDLQGVLDAAPSPESVLFDVDEWGDRVLVWCDDQPCGISDSHVADSETRWSVDLPDGASLLLAATHDDEFEFRAAHVPADGDREPVSLEALDERAHYWRVPELASDVRVQAFDFGRGHTQASSDADPKDGSRTYSALFDLDIRDVTGMDHLDRGKNPIKHRGDSENYFVIIKESGDYLAYDHKAEAGYYALTYLLCEAGERSVDNPTGELSDRDIFTAWKHSKRAGYVSTRDPVPYRALLHVVREHDLLPADMVPDPDSYGDDEKRLPASVYNRALNVIEDEYGLDSGRTPAKGGKHLPTEEELGLDKEPEDEREAALQVFKTAEYNARLNSGD